MHTGFRLKKRFQVSRIANRAARTAILIPLFLLTLHFFTACHTNNANPGNPPAMQHPSYPWPVYKVQLDSGIELAYMDEGQGDYTLLFLHGLASYAPAWSMNLAELKKHYRCVAVDLPNYGLSGMGTFDFTMSFFAEIVRDFANKLELENLVLVGHSMGGQVAMTTVLNTDLAVQKLVLISPAGFETYTDTEVAWFQQIYTPLVIKMTPVQQVEKNFDLNFADKKLPPEARFMFDDRLELMEDTEAFNLYAEMIPKCVMGMLNEPVFDRLSQIQLPTLIIYGEEDWLIPNRFLHSNLTTKDVAQSGQEQIANSQLKMFSPCGHFVNWECAERVNDEIQAFLD